MGAEKFTEFFGHLIPYVDNEDGTITVQVKDIPYIPPPPLPVVRDET